MKTSNFIKLLTLQSVSSSKLTKDFEFECLKCPITDAQQLGIMFHEMTDDSQIKSMSRFCRK